MNLTPITPYEPTLTDEPATGTGTDLADYLDRVDTETQPDTDR